MTVDPEDFRRRFADLSDDALLEINRDELVDIARDLYDAEVARRGIETQSEATEAPAAAAEETAPPKEELVMADEFTSAQELAFARSLLRSAEIPSYVESDFAVGAAGMTGEGLRLFVPASFLTQAQEVLDATLTDEELAAQAEAAGSAEAIEDAEIAGEEDVANEDEDLPA